MLVILLGSFFFLSYGFANWVTSRRANVPSVAFGWERRLPFLPWTIVPYWSSDILFAASLLVCTTRRELHVQGKRLFAIQVISIACFLAFPLRCAFERPGTHGVFGWLFDVLAGFDRPFNQAPSLHVGLAVIFWSRFSAHLNGFWRFLAGAWLILAGLSTITTYQHQFIDLPAGLVAGALAIALIPDRSVLARQEQRRRMATFYLSGSVVTAAVAGKISGFAWILLWPAASLLLVAITYAADLPGIFQKRNAALYPMAALLAAPYLLAAWINARWWTRDAAPANEISDGVWLGRAPVWFDSAGIGDGPVRERSIVNVAAEFPARAAGVECKCVPMLDLVLPRREQLSEAVAAIERFSLRRPTRVCCALGFSRSAITVAAWLMATGRAASADQALSMIRRRRPRVVIGDESRSLIEEYARSEEDVARGI